MKTLFRKFTSGFPKMEQSLIAIFVIDLQIAKEEQLDAFLSFGYFGKHDGLGLTCFDPASRIFLVEPRET